MIIEKQFKFIDNYDDSLSIKIEFYYDGMNIETEKHLSTLIEKIEVDIIM